MARNAIANARRFMRRTLDPREMFDLSVVESVLAGSAANDLLALRIDLERQIKSLEEQVQKAVSIVPPKLHRRRGKRLSSDAFLPRLLARFAKLRARLQDELENVRIAFIRERQIMQRIVAEPSHPFVQHAFLAGALDVRSEQIMRELEDELELLETAIRVHRRSATGGDKFRSQAVVALQLAKAQQRQKLIAHFEDMQRLRELMIRAYPR